MISTFKKKPYKDAWFYSFKDSYFVGINTKGEFCAVTAETSDAGDKSLNIWEERTVTLSDEVLTIMPNYITQALIKMEISVNTEINNMSSLLEEAENAGIIIMK